MGFSYSQWGLCCDFCGNSKPEFNVKKIPCSFGWCQDWACCKECKAKGRDDQASCWPGEITHEEYCKERTRKYEHQKLNKEFWLTC